MHRILPFHRSNVLSIIRTNQASDYMKKTFFSSSLLSHSVIVSGVSFSSALYLSFHRTETCTSDQFSHRVCARLWFASPVEFMDTTQHHSLSLGPLSTKNLHGDVAGMIIGGLPTMDDTEADVLNDETFGDCDLDAIKIKSDFGENGEFLGESLPEGLPDFFDTDMSDPGGGVGISLLEHDDQSQQPSIDALLGEDSMRMSSTSMNLRQSSINPLFNMAISQARESNHGSIFSPQQQQQIPRVSPMPIPPTHSSSSSSSHRSRSITSS